MNEGNRETIANFWRFHRPPEAAAKALNIPLAQVEEIFAQLTAAQNLRDARLKVLAKRLSVLLAVLLAIPLVNAQTISPVITELASKNSKPVSSSFTVRNDGVVPLAVVVESPQSMTFENGTPRLGPLAPTVHVELSEQSAKIGAKQQHEFGYKLRCDAFPCALTIYTTITGPHTSSGIAVAIHLPHVIYFCEKAKGCRARVLGGKP